MNLTITLLSLIISFFSNTTLIYSTSTLFKYNKEILSNITNHTGYFNIDDYIHTYISLKYYYFLIKSQNYLQIKNDIHHINTLIENLINLKFISYFISDISL